MPCPIEKLGEIRKMSAKKPQKLEKQENWSRCHCGCKGNYRICCVSLKSSGQIIMVIINSLLCCTWLEKICHLKLFSPVCVIASCGRNAASFVFFAFTQKIELNCRFFWCPSLWPLQVCPGLLYSFNSFLHLCNFTEKASKNIDQKIPRIERMYSLKSVFSHQLQSKMW